MAEQRSSKRTLGVMGIVESFGIRKTRDFCSTHKAFAVLVFLCV